MGNSWNWDARRRSFPTTPPTARPTSTSTGSSDEHHSVIDLQHRDQRPQPLVWQLPSAEECQRQHPPRPDLRADRPVRLREDNAASLLQPHQRKLWLRYHKGRNQDPPAKHLHPRNLADRAAQGGWHGFPTP